ncbi:MAG: hypothetical protein OXN18_14865 [Gemmatimonadota bacterium]|nr:hypothetical protein [Gemmatimonadota bacterium]
MTPRGAATLARITVLVAPFVVWVPGSAAQEERAAIPGVSLGFVYEGERIPPIALQPFTGGGAAAEIASIIATDLDYSDRFYVRDSLPAGVDTEGIQYSLWDQYGVDWLLTGNIDREDGVTFLDVELHDIVFSSIRSRARFPIPPPGHEAFRLAVHRISDAVVEWVHGEPGMAASRIVFSMRPFGNPDSKELYVVDSDGEGLQRATWDDDLAVSPAWSPDGVRIAYTSYKSGLPRIYELNLVDGSERTVESNSSGAQQFSPSYHPDGDRIAFWTLEGGDTKGISTYNIRDGCCLTRLIAGYHQNIQPSYSRDGSKLAFLSNRLGPQTPQIYVMPGEGGDAELLSPYQYGQGGYFADPDWSPTADKVAFAGGIVDERVYNQYDIFVRDMDAPDNRLVRLTNEGNNEDPSWAPDGRHLVFAGARSYGYGVLVVDTATGRTRLLVAGVRAEDTDWSPGLSWRGDGVETGGPGSGTRPKDAR